MSINSGKEDPTDLPEIYLLADSKLTNADDRRINSSVIPVQTHSSFCHTGVFLGSLWIQIDHDTPLISHGNAYGWTVCLGAEAHTSSEPAVLGKGFKAIRLDNNVGSKPSHIELSPRLASHLQYRFQTYDGNRSFVEDAMIELH